jgi:hypothetical protein
MTARKSPWRGRILTLFLLGTVGGVLLGLLGGVANAGACQGVPTKSWTGVVNNSWHEDGNWLPVGVPAAGDDVCINLAVNTPVLFTAGTTDIDTLDAEVPLTISGGVLNLNDDLTDSEATNLTLSGGTRGGAGKLIVQPGGSMTWSGGTLSGVGTTQISSTATLAIQGGSKTLNNHTLDNQGTTTWSAGNISSGNSAVVANSGTFDITADLTMAYEQGGNVVQWNNTGSGLIHKTAGAGVADLQAAVDNDAQVTSSSGELRLGAGTTFNDDAADNSTGDFTATAGDTVNFGGGTHRIGEATSSVNGLGTISFTGGTTHVGADTAYAVTGTTLVAGGTANFNTTAGTTEDFTLSSGTLGGTGLLTVGDQGTWTGGAMSNTGTLRIDTGSTLAISTTTAKTLNNHTLDNQGTTTWSAGNISSGNSAVVANSGTFDITADLTMAYEQGGVVTQWNNTGMLVKSAGAGTTDLQVSMDNEPGTTDGTIDVSSGTLFLNGAFANYDSTTDTLSGGIYDLSGTLKFINADIVTNSAAIILDGPSAQIVDTAGTPQDGLRNFATNTSAGAFTIRNNKDVTTPGAFSNAGDVTMGGNSTFTSTGDYTQSGGLTLLGTTTSELVASGACVDIQGGVLRGRGTAEPCVDVSGGQVQPGLSPGILNVDGTYTQSAGTLDIEVGGTTPGTGHDQLAVTGAADLGGAMALDTVSAFSPSDGDSFVVMTYGSRVGTSTFDTVTWADLDPSLNFTVNYNPTNVTVTVQGVGVPTVSIGDDTVTEGDAGTVDAEFAVILSEPAPAGGVTVDYDTADGTAAAPDDYVAESGTVTFVEGDDTETVTIAVNGDTDVEPNETFFVDLSNPSGATISDGQGLGTIIDDDGAATADLQVGKRVKSRGDIVVGKKFQFVLRVQNNGPDQATNVTLVDDLPSEVVFLSYRSAQATCVHDAGTVTCDVGSLASGTVGRVFLVVRTVSAGDTSNTVTGTATEADPDSNNNEATVLFTIGPAV